MNAIGRIIAVQMFAFATTAAHGQAVSTSPDSVSKGERALDTLELLVKALDAGRESSLFKGGTTTCSVDGSSPCSISVSITELFDKPGGKLVACIVRTDNITADFGQKPQPGDRINIAWTLGPLPIATPAKYTFTDPGLLILQDDAVTTSGKADGHSQMWDQITMYYRWKHRQSAKPAEHVNAIYYPIVLQTLPGQSPTLCAAGDPKIVNID